MAFEFLMNKSNVAKKIVALVAIMIVVTFVITSFSVFMLYTTAKEDAKKSLYNLITHESTIIKNLSDLRILVKIL